jgi:hypothetical protein
VEVVLRNGADPLRVPVTLLERVGESIERTALKKLKIPPTK